MSIIINRNIIFLDSLQFVKLLQILQQEICKIMILNIYCPNFQQINQKYSEKKTHIHMNVQIVMKNLIIKNYHLKKLFIHQQMMEKEVKVMDIFLMNNIHIYKMFGIHLILKHLRIFIVIILKKSHYYQLMFIKNLFLLV